MQTYANLSGNSNVERYSSFQQAIIVRFKDKWVYAYMAYTAGQPAVDRMKALAQAGRGLNSFIARTKPAYSQKWFDVDIG